MRAPAYAILFALLFCRAAVAAEWPENWLGPQDNQYRVLKIGVYYFGAVLHDFPDDEGNPPFPGSASGWVDKMAALPELDDASMQTEFERVRGELDLASEFYWRNSRFNCALDYVYHTDFTPRLRSSIAGDDAPYFSPVDHDYFGDARDRYDGLMEIMVLYHYNKKTKQLERIKGGGGFTWGCDAKTGKCGWSWWAACTKDNVCGSDWLVVHEFGHQLDSLFDQSGHPEFWFNHLAPSEGNTARFGEHFDVNSYILRRVPEADWHDLKWGTMRTFTDADGDGVPAADDWLIARHLLTDVDDTKRDTDSDGMSDFAEIMAANGNRHGHGERLHPLIDYCNPRDPDTDGDGLIDGLDPLPMLAMPNYILRRPAGNEPEDSTAYQPADYKDFYYGLELRYLATFSEDEPNTPPSLEIGISANLLGESGDDLEYKVMLDLDNDGWFSGSDNYQLKFTSSEIQSFTRNDASSHTEWPHVDPVQGDLTNVLHAGKDGACVLILPQELIPELAGKPGEMIGFNIGVRHAGETWYRTLWEPNALLPLELR